MSDLGRKEYFELCRKKFDEICNLRNEKKIDNHYFMVLGEELIAWSSVKAKNITWDTMYFNLNNYFSNSILKAQRAFSLTKPEDRYFYESEKEE